MAQELSESDCTFFHGVLAALAVVNSFGQDTLFDEIVGTCGGSYLVKVARLSGQMRISGMSNYLRRKNDRG